MKIKHFTDFDEAYNSIIPLIPKVQGTDSFWNDLQLKIEKKQEITFQEYAALYYGASFVVKSEEEKGLPEMATVSERFVLDLYVTLLAESGGEEFFEGTDEYTDEEYEQFSQAMINEVIEMKIVAEKYVEGIEVFEPVFFKTIKGPVRFRRQSLPTE
ncbi:hypothetical protein [Bacillus alkalicellulosilyticus]|uniref:hypothetical protein n=1 Tax=Alkalihalobacterium alkalicellulosilyticum TaxID=1912214 RepID=UPI00099827D4|nr:hypothetical protein [Bacillus alkalicellulosilyticus]